MDKSILQLLDEVQQLLLTDKTDWAQPNRVFLSCNFLAPPNFTGTLGTLCHSYNPSTEVIKFHIENHSHLDMIFHGHREDELCSAPTFCHLLDYRPDATNSPAFRKAFQLKWNY